MFELFLRFPTIELASFAVPDSCWNLLSQPKPQDQLLVDQLVTLKSINVSKVDKGTDWWAYVTRSAPGAWGSQLTRNPTDPKRKPLAFGIGESELVLETQRRPV